MSSTGENSFSEDDNKKHLFPNLLELSTDLKSVFDQHIQSDLSLLVNGKNIRCHRDILCVRSKWFSLRIHQAHSSGVNSISFQESDQILNAVLLYIYTGNLQLIETLNVPLLELREASEKYGLQRLKKILTNIIKSENVPEEKKSTEFLWNIKIDGTSSLTFDCSSLDDFSLHGTDKWYLKIQPIHLADGKCNTGIYIVRETEKEALRVTYIVNFKIHIIDSYGRKQCFFEGDRTLSEDGEYKITEFIPLSDLMENSDLFLPGGMLTLACELTICAKYGNSELFQLKGHHRRCISNELLALSHDMHEIMKFGKFSDISIHVKRSALLKVHSYILLARSQMPISLLSKIGDLAGFGCIMWRSFIHFMYTAQTCYLDDHVRIIYSTISKLNLAEAKQKYSKLLAINLSIDNAYSTLCDAVVNGDNDLISSAANFLACNSSVKDHHAWIKFAIDNVKWQR